MAATDSATTISDPAFDAVVKQFAESMSESREISRQLGESAKVKTGIAQRLLTDRPPPAPALAAPVPPPAAPSQTNPFQAFGSMASLLGIAGGLLSRSPLTASLNAASGAMNAYRQRDLEAYKRNYETWKAQSDYALRVSEWQQNQYQQALDSFKGNHDSLVATMNAIAARDQDLVMQHTIRTGDLTNAMQLLSDRARINTEYRRAQTEADRLAEDSRHHLEQEKEQEERISVTRANQQARSAVKQAGAKQTDAIIGQIDSLISQVEQHPEVVSTVGEVTRAGETIESWMRRIAGQPMQDTPASRFASALQALRMQTSTALTGSKYYSGVRQQQMQQILPGLEHFESPDAVVANLRQMRIILENAKLDAEVGLTDVPIIVNPGTGERMILRDGQWQPIQ